MNKAGPCSQLHFRKGCRDLTFLQCCSTPSTTKHPKNHPQLSALLLRATPGEGASPSSRAERGRGWQGWEGHSCLPTDRSFPFPTSQDGMRLGRRGSTASLGVQLLCPSGLCILGGSTGDSLASFHSRCCTPGGVPKADMAIPSLNPRKREGNPPPSLSLLPLLLFNAPWNVHSLFLLGFTGHNTWKALSAHTGGESNCHDMGWFLDLKQQHREGYFVCNLTRSAQYFPTVLFLQM